MRVLVDQQDRNITEEYTARLPVRGALVAPDGEVIRIPIDGRKPDAFTIIAALQFVIEQYGRDPRVRAKAMSLIHSRINNDVDRNASTIASWVMNSMVYLADPDGAEFVQTPMVLMRQIDMRGRAYGDCDDHVVLLGSLLNAIGIQAEAVGVKLFGAANYNHVVIQYLSNGRMVLIDPCAKNAPTPMYGERLVVR